MNSQIILVKNIGMDKSYTNVLNYTESQMLALCRANAIASADNYSFLRPTGTIFVGFTYAQCIQSNYIAFQNPDYSNKWFFAFIDDVIYKGDRNVEIKFTIDAWSTWFDKWTPKKCFINRQHVTNDTVGLHTVPENLDIGQLICDFTKNDTNLGAESYFYFVIGCNYDPSSQTRTAGVGMYADYPQGCFWFAWLVNRINYENTINDISQWIYDITQQMHADDIQTMFALPYQAFELIGDIDPTTHKVINGKGIKLDVNETFSKSTFRKFSDYTPKNNKLFVYPYSFCRVTNNMGSYNDYKIEDFNELDMNDNPTDNMTFNLIGIPCLGYSGKLRPKYYQGITNNEDESLQLGKYPMLSWSSDAFTNWVSQNNANMVGGIIGMSTSATTQLVGGAMTLNPFSIVGGISSIASGVANMIGTIDKASALPNTAQGNANSGDVSFGFNLNRFKYLHMRPKKEYLQIIDDYFTRFGYKICKLENPNINGRRYWNYIEIGGSEEIGTGEVPSKFMEEINNACRKGVTIWHNHANIGDYSLNNTIT
jgi:hypothetical protein